MGLSFLLFICHQAHPLLQELQAAVAFVGHVQGQACVAEILTVLEQLLGSSNDSSAVAAASGTGTTACTTPVGLCIVAVTQGLLPGAAAAAGSSPGSLRDPADSAAAAAAATVAVPADLMKRRLMPLLMVLLSRGEPPVQSACVGALLEVLLRFGEDSKLVEQVRNRTMGCDSAGKAHGDGVLINCGQELTGPVLPFYILPRFVSCSTACSTRLPRRWRPPC